MTIDETQVISIQQPVQSQTTRASNSAQTSDSKQNTSKSFETNFKDQSDFVQRMTNAYATELQKRGYDPAFAEYLVAQDALESG
jgi:flagellum-specific peptidoglycan hydrolase FlgJ